MRFGQIANRLRIRGKRKLVSLIPHAERLYPESSPGYAIPLHTKESLLPGLPKIIGNPLSKGLSETVMKAGEDLRSHRFDYVGECAIYRDRISWNDKNHSRLWRMNLHYFNSAPLFILDMVINQKKEDFYHWKWLVESWINENPMGCFEAWNPYCLSRRIPNWIIAYQLLILAGIDDSEFNKKFLRAIYQQSAYLYGNVEWDLPMNHLTANGRALCYSGLFFKDERAKKWLKLGLKLIFDRLVKDVCFDGGHAERSPMYHLLVLQDCLECLMICSRAGIQWPEKILSILRKMTKFSHFIQHPDGDIPLFNDSALKIAAKSNEVVCVASTVLGDCGISAAIHDDEISLFGSLFSINKTKIGDHKNTPLKRLVDFSETGYFVINGPEIGNKIIFDCGEVGIKEVGGHAHSDLLSYELSVAGERVVVDTGTSIYADGPRRQYERSIFAHNTISIDNCDTCEPWSSYRLARRGHPGKVKTFEKDNIVIIDAGHSSFLKLRGISHRRALISIGSHLIVFDRIGGNKRHSMVGMLHFHPEIKLVALPSCKDKFKIIGKNIELILQCFGAETSIFSSSKDRLSGWYAPEFGKIIRVSGINMRWKGQLPTQCGHIFTISSTKIESSYIHDKWNLILTNEYEEYNILISFQSIKLIKPFYFEYCWI